MPYDPKYHHRRSIRLKGYDYSQAGLYFITICCQEKVCRFGRIENGEMILNDYGEIVGVYKSLVSKRCLEIYKSKNEMMGRFWQRNYYEHIIRNEKSYHRIVEYIIKNPKNWTMDTLFSQ